MSKDILEQQEQYLRDWAKRGYEANHYTTELYCLTCGAATKQDAATLHDSWHQYLYERLPNPYG